MKKKVTRRKYCSWIIIGAIVFLGIFLRLYGIGDPSLWHNEIATFHRANGDLAHTVSTLHDTPFPPLYYLMMNLWIRSFGGTEISLRFPSFIFSSLSIIFIYLFARDIFNKKVGFVAAFLLSISPYAVNYAQEAKMYSMFWFFTLLSFLFFYRFLKKGGEKNLIFYAASTLISLYTTYISLYILFIQNLFFIYQYFNIKKKFAKQWILSQLVVLAGISFFSPHFYGKASNPSFIAWVTGTENYLVSLINILKGLLGTLVGYHMRVEFVFFMFFFFVAVIVFLKNGVREHKKKSNYILLFIWIALPCIVYIVIDIYFTNIMIERYFSIILFPLLILISKGIETIDSYLKNSLYISLIIILIFSISLHLIPYYKYDLKINNEAFYYTALFEEYPKSRVRDWKSTVSEVCTQSDNGDVLLMSYTSMLEASYYGSCYEGDVYVKFLHHQYNWVFNDTEYFDDLFQGDLFLMDDFNRDVPFERYDSVFIIGRNIGELYMFKSIFRKDDWPPSVITEVDGKSIEFLPEGQVWYARLK